MQKIFELTAKDFFTGVSEFSHGSKGLFFNAEGIAPFVNPRRTSDDFGLLQTFSAPTDMTGEVVADIPRAWASEAVASNDGYLYSLGSAGHFYVIHMTSGADTITDEKSGTQISNPAN